MAHANQNSRLGGNILVGTGGEVSRRLQLSSAQRALAVIFTDDEQSALLEDVVRKVAEFLPHIVRRRREEALEKLVGALLPEMAVPDAALAQARMLVDAKSTILRSGDFVPAGEIAKLAGYSDKNPSAQPNRWKKSGAIFAIQHKGMDYFPLYTLDPDQNYRPYKAVAAILGIFGDTKSGWEIAFWFAGLNSFLDDSRPQDLLASNPDMVISAAKDEVEGVRHG